MKKIPIEVYQNEFKFHLFKLDSSNNVINHLKGYHVFWIKWDKKGNYIDHKKFNEPNIEYSLCLDFDGNVCKWETSPVKEIIHIHQNEYEFKTTTGHYKLLIK